MYCTDASTGQTRFEIDQSAAAREVVLECFNEQERFRVPMTRKQARWTACVTVVSSIAFMWMVAPTGIMTQAG
jgi:hypothetical protein